MSDEVEIVEASRIYGDVYGDDKVDTPLSHDEIASVRRVAHLDGYDAGRAAERAEVTAYLKIIADAVRKEHRLIYVLGLMTSKDPLDVIQAAILTTLDVIEHGRHAEMADAMKKEKEQAGG